MCIRDRDERLRQEGIRSTVSLVASGTLRNAADVVRAVALGADAVSIGSAALIAMGCHQCGDCASGRCNWGIATQRADLVGRLNPEAAATATAIGVMSVMVPTDVPIESDTKQLTTNSTATEYSAGMTDSMR